MKWLLLFHLAFALGVCFNLILGVSFLSLALSMFKLAIPDMDIPRIAQIARFGLFCFSFFFFSREDKNLSVKISCGVLRGEPLY